MAIRNLEPSLLWSHFYELNQIPRASKHEESVRAFYRAYATNRGLEFKEDRVGNIVIKKPATIGYEHAPKVILQGHVDMVCQKNNTSSHDFRKDPISMHIDGEWVTANQTTLGADNGIGVAAAIAILEDPSAEHGPLEVLLTVDEEAGMGGVRGLQPQWLEGDYLINLDSEEWGKCCVGCAGGVEINLYQDLDYEEGIQGNYVEISLKGLKGGHSGLDIHTGRGNANQLLSEVMSDLSSHMPVRLVSFQGGTLKNAITREAFCQIAYDEMHKEALEEHLKLWQEVLLVRHKNVDEGVLLSCTESLPAPSLATEQTHALLALLTLLPHGVIRQSIELPVVETSSNIGTVEISKEKGLLIGLLARSLTEEGLNVIKIRARNLSHLSHCFFEIKNEYPAWTPNLKAYPLLKLQETYRDITHKELDIEVIHAGLETGLIGQLYPQLEMVSFGPTIENAHSPDERVHIQSVYNFYNLLKEFLKRLKKS